MERIKIFDTELPVKDYYCTDSPTNIKKTRPTLRLYIKLTDQCLAHCKFCSNEQSKDFGTIDLEKLAFVIRYLKENLGIELLDDKTKEIIDYREKYPEASLLELSEIISYETGKPITKSGLNHRFRKIRELAEKIKK